MRTTRCASICPSPRSNCSSAFSVSNSISLPLVVGFKIFSCCFSFPCSACFTQDSPVFFPPSLMTRSSHAQSETDRCVLKVCMHLLFILYLPSVSIPPSLGSLVGVFGRTHLGCWCWSKCVHGCACAPEILLSSPRPPCFQFWTWRLQLSHAACFPPVAPLSWMFEAHLLLVCPAQMPPRQFTVLLSKHEFLTFLLASYPQSFLPFDFPRWSFQPPRAPFFICFSLLLCSLQPGALPSPVLLHISRSVQFSGIFTEATAAHHMPHFLLSVHSGYQVGASF